MAVSDLQLALAKIHAHDFIHVYLLLLLEAFFAAYVLAVAQLFIHLLSYVLVPVKILKLFKEEPIAALHQIGLTFSHSSSSLLGLQIATSACQIVGGGLTI